MHINDILNIANPKQLEAIKHPLAPLMIIAGAGTGKTFTLENRIVYMIQKYEVEPKNILTITYTEKAANELKSRLINKVGQKAHPMFVGTFHVILCIRLWNGCYTWGTLRIRVQICLGSWIHVCLILYVSV